MRITRDVFNILYLLPSYYYYYIIISYIWTVKRDKD